MHSGNRSRNRSWVCWCMCQRLVLLLLVVLDHLLLRNLRRYSHMRHPSLCGSSMVLGLCLQSRRKPVGSTLRWLHQVLAVWCRRLWSRSRCRLLLLLLRCLLLLLLRWLLLLMMLLLGLHPCLLDLHHVGVVRYRELVCHGVRVLMFSNHLCLLDHPRKGCLW